MKFLCLLVATIAPVLANPLTPDQAALEFLDAVRVGKVKTAPNGGTALSVHTNPEKLQRIARLLERMANDLGNQPLRVSQVKTDDNLAAVMVWKDEGNDPSHMQVFPVAMVKRGEQWLPAPVPGSFENCGVGLDLESRKRMETLEDWMLTQRTLDLAKLRSLCIERMRGRISQHIDRPTLARMNQQQVLDRLFNACLKGNSDEMLGLLGGFSDPLPDYWPDLVLSLQSAVSGDASSPWRLLMNDGVLRVEIPQVKDRLPPNIGGELDPIDKDFVTLGCLDTEAGPLGKDGLPLIQLVHLELIKDENGLWRVQPPAFFWDSQDETKGAADPTLDKSELNAFPAAVRMAHPVAGAATTDEAIKQLMAALDGNRFEQVLPLLQIDPDAERGRSAILHAAKLWSTLHGESGAAGAASSQMLLPLESTTRQDLAIISCQLYSSRKPDRFNNTLLHLVRTDKVWLWQPDPGSQDVEAFKAFEDWQIDRCREWQHTWRTRMVAQVPVLEGIPAANAPTEAQCRQLMNDWAKAIKAGDIRLAIQCCTMLNIPDSPTVLLRNLGYEITANLRDETIIRFDQHLTDQGWAAAGMTQTSGESEIHPMYPIVSTAQGPRILLEIDLISGGDRGRQYLNQTSINRLRNFDAAAAASLQKLFAEHQQSRAGPKKTSP